MGHAGRTEPDAKRRRLLLGAAASLPLAAALPPPRPTRAQQDAFPRQQIRLIVPFAPGTGSDAIARVVADELRDRLGQPMVVENRGGAGGITGTEQGARAAPDGHTLTLGTTSTFLVNPTLNPRAGYAFERDFAPVAGIGRSFYAVVAAGSPGAPRDLAELLDRLRAPAPTAPSPLPASAPSPTSPPRSCCARPGSRRRTSLTAAAAPPWPT